MSKYLEIPAHLVPLIEKRDYSAGRRGNDRRKKKSKPGSKSAAAAGERRSGRDSRMKPRRRSDNR